MKNKYIDLMEAVFCVYTDEQIDQYLKRTKENGISEHGFPRLVANLGILIAHGRKLELKKFFAEMMELCCDEIPIALAKNGSSAGNDFSVKEIIFCLLEIEKANVFDKSVTSLWREKLGCINPYETYSVISPVPPVRIGNWAAFGAASEQLRKYAGVGCEDEFIENQIKSQLFSFDENGMYRDPNEPMVYDFVTRLQLATALFFGYEGESRAELENYFLKSADITLKMQSVSGEIPFGGRSNQFLHNEAFYAALCEYYAALFKKKGDTEKASEFKCAAGKAIDNLRLWLDCEVVHHVKNHFDTETMYGCETYAYFDKYMVTTGSWLYLAYVFCDDGIDKGKGHEENYICKTTEYFHRQFCRFNDYFIQTDTNADIHYDCSGLGRVHKKGVPSALCISTPFSKHPNYKLDIENPSAYSISAGVETRNGFVYGFDEGVKYELVHEEVTDSSALLKFNCTNEDGFLFTQLISVSDLGVEVVAEGEGEVEIAFPVFDFDGAVKTDITVSENEVCVSYKGHSCRFSGDGRIVDKNMLLANRNGHYKGFSVCGRDKAVLKIRMD